MQRNRSMVGSLLGIAVGDAIGLPYENLSPWRGQVLLGEPDRHHFVFGRGMVSDDTELSCLTAQSLIASDGDIDRFRADLASRLRWWLFSFPLGGGAATYFAAGRLCLGWSAETCGTFSAGNAPAVRAVVLGAAIEDLDALKAFVAASTSLTHTDPLARFGSMAIAVLARFARADWPLKGSDYLEFLRSLLPEESARELLSLIEDAIRAAEDGLSTAEFAASKNWQSGVSGFIVPTVATSIHAIFRHPGDFRAAVMGVIRCGGDADSTAAIVGGVLGTALGRDAIPIDWIDGLWEPQRTAEWMEELAQRLAEPREPPPPELSYFPLLGRNLFFATIVLAHIFRRWLPPYW